MATEVKTTMYRIAFSVASAKGYISQNRQLIIAAANEDEAVKNAATKLERDYRWHKITGVFKA